jgi:putative acetyltransferase
MTNVPTLLFAIDDPRAPDVHALLMLLDHFLASQYPPDSERAPTPIQSLSAEPITVVSARVDGEAVACGACVRHDDYVELRHMYVLPACRGLGLGRQLLDAMEQHVRAMGVGWVRLETGIAETEAIELYEHAGYHRCAPFGEYRSNPLSIYMEKSLA